jgi:uncharacterized protein (TIGR04255 family)
MEVALAVQFGEPSLDTLDVAAFGERLRPEFPQREEQAPMPPLEERFEGGPQPSVRFEILQTPPTPRFWFLSEDQSRLVQVQNHTVAHNWRRRGSGEYPHYSALREALSRYLHELEDLLRAAGKPRLEPNWCEVTYINHVPQAVDADRLPLDEVLTMVSAMDSPTFLPPAEDAQLAARFRIEENGAPVGRLTVLAAPAISAIDGQKIWALTMSAKALSAEPNVLSAFERLDLCHEWVVRGFRDVTTARMHDVWGLKEGPG